MKRFIIIWALFIAYTAWVIFVLKLNRGSLLYPLLFAPFIEELVFRKAVLDIVLANEKSRKLVWRYIFISSFIFGYIHFNKNMYVIQGLFGVIMSYVYLKYRNYWYVVILHFKWNLFATFWLKYVIVWFDKL